MKSLFLFSFWVLFPFAQFPIIPNAYHPNSSSTSIVIPSDGGGMIDIIQRTDILTILVSSDFPQQSFISVFEDGEKQKFTKSFVTPATINIPIQDWNRGNYEIRAIIGNSKKSITFSI